MNILFTCLRSTINPSMARMYTMQSYYRGSIIHNKHLLLTANRSSVQLLASNRCFMKKMGFKQIYDVYDKKAAKDKVSPTEYMLVYNGVGEMYVRYLSAAVVAASVILPSVFVYTYVYLLFTEGHIDLNTYFNILLIPHSAVELIIMLSVLFSLKLASYSFITKYVLRIYKHHMKKQYIGVFINPLFPWKNITCTFDKAIKLPNGKITLIPWYNEYYKLAGNKSIVLRERFRRPIDYDRMLGLEKSMDEL